jgi:hypothetical protein
MVNWILLHGTKEPPIERIPLQAGPISLFFEAGTLRYIRLGEHEILRHLYMGLRPPDWSTVIPVLSNLQINAHEDHFEITFTADHKQGEVDFVWQGRITGDAQGTIRFSMDGKANRNFWRARIGFCILHPMSVAGLPVELLKVDGTRERSVFPKAISPHQPFMDLQGMTHEVQPGVLAEVRFEGEIFETEDHRNWTDASYKTYCTPLRLPRRVEVKAGEKIVQSVTLSLHSSQEWKEGMVREWEKHARTHTPVAVASPQAKPLTIQWSTPTTELPLPPIGLGMASHDQPLTSQEVTRLKALNISHLRADVLLSNPDYENRLQRATTEAQKLGVELEVALFLSDATQEELNRLKGSLARIKPPVCRWLIFHDKESSTTEKWVQLARPILKDYAPTSKIGAGSNAYFTEVNRGHPPTEIIDFVCYSLNPQVHAFDDATLVENLEGQGVTLSSARTFMGNTPLAVTPVTLRPRLQPDGSAPEPKASPGELPPQVDVRQMSLFGVIWTIGSLKYLSEGGASSITYYETTGWRGVMETEGGSPLPDKFPSKPGMVFPLYHVLADVGQFAGGTVIPTHSNNTLQTDAFAIRKEGRIRMFVANFSPEPRQITVMELPTSVRVLYLDEYTIEQVRYQAEAFRQEKGKEVETKEGQLKLDLHPYALARIDY